MFLTRKYFYTITELADTALNAQVQGGARQKNLKGSLLPMSATNKGRIKTGHKTMIYVLSLMSAAFAVRPPVRRSVHPLGLSIPPSTMLFVHIGIHKSFLPPLVHHCFFLFLFIIFLIAFFLVIVLLFLRFFFFSIGFVG